MSTTVPKILIVEHEPVALTDLERDLAKLGYSAAGVAGTGGDALKLAEKILPDLVLMNLRLQGGMDGIETAGEIRRRWQIPVIYMASENDDEMWARAKSTGPFVLLTKPFGAWSLQATFWMALSHQQLSHEAFENRSWLKAVLSSTQDGVIATDGAGQVRFMSPVAEEITGWYQSEATGKPIERVYPLLEFDGQALQEHPVRQCLDRGSARRKGRLLLACRDGRQIPVEDASVPLYNMRGEINGAVTVFCDITERIRMEQFRMKEREQLEEQMALTAEALGTTRTELRALISRATTAQEEERRRVARELHDDLGQRIALLQFEAERMRQYALAPEVHAGLKRFIEEAATFSSALRELSHRLHPSLLEDLGLAAALRSLVEDYRRQGVDVTLSAGEPTGYASLDVRTSLYRIAQEALRNAWKHAPDAAVHIRLLEENKELRLTIEDTGPGFDLSRARSSGGLGLLSMQERARLVGGSLLLSSHPEGGTTLLVRVPMSTQA